MKTIYPIFRKDTGYVYKQISEGLLIQVYNSKFNEACCINYFDNDLIANKLTEEISEAEFLEAFYQVRKRLNQICDINFDLL